MTFALVGETIPLKLNLTPRDSTQSGSIVFKGGYLEGKSQPKISLLQGNDGDSHLVSTLLHTCRSHKQLYA